MHTKFIMWTQRSMEGKSIFREMNISYQFKVDIDEEY